MKIGSTFDPALEFSATSLTAAPPLDDPTTGCPPPLTPELVEATRHEVVRITREITALSQQPIPVEEFFAEFLTRVNAALASVGGAAWTVDEQGVPQAMGQINWQTVSSSAAADWHRQLLAQALAEGQPCALPPGSRLSSWDVTNPTEYLILLAPMRLEGQVVGLVEVFQRPHRGPATERGYLSYLAQMSELAGAYMKNERLRRLTSQRAWSDQVERFLVEVHRHLGLEETAYSVVNEARRLTGVDRVSLALGQGRQTRLAVVSGLDSLDRRADQVRQLARLSRCVMRGRETIWLETNRVDLPPQIEKEWNRYVDISHVRRCAILPLFAPGSSDPPADEATRFEATPFGALIFEQLQEAVPDAQRDRRIAQLSRHGATALYKVLAHEKLFLLPLWRLLGNICEALGGRHFTKTLSATVLFVASAVALTTVQTPFSIPVRGMLQPVLRRTVFAPEDGVVMRLGVDHGTFVRAGQVLLELRNTDLEVEIMSLVGRQTATREQILSLQRTLLEDRRLDTSQQNRINGELLQLQQLSHSIQQQLELLRQKEQQLMLRAARDGQIVTWHLRDQLLHRPVQKGQALMAMVDPAAAWELELFVPERHIGLVMDAAACQEAPLRVTFVMSSHPGQQFEGHLAAIDHVAVAREEYGNTVRICVAIDKHQLPELRTGATVVAKILCGQRSVGYAWFHDLIDTVAGRVRFWL